MSNNENILENMSRDYLEIELDAIKNENMIKTKQIEDYKLQINKLKHRIAILKSMEGYFFSEIESLKSIHEAKIEELMRKICIHEEQISLLHQKHTETIKYYENELIKKETDVEYTNEVKKSTHNLCKKDNFLIITKLEIKINDLQDELSEYKLINNTLNNENNDLKKELLELKEQLQVKDIQLDENKDLIYNLQNEVTQIQSEISIIKMFPAKH